MRLLSSSRYTIVLRAILVIWVACFAPLYCQYHGLLIGPASHARHSVHHHTDASLVDCQHADNSTTPTDALLHHETSGKALPVAAVTIAAPPALLLAYDPPTQPVIAIRVSRPASIDLPPPDQPPRLSA